MARASTAKTLGDLLRPVVEKVEPAITSWLSGGGVPAPLAEAMRYACLAGGKRLRPALVFFAAEAVAPRQDWPVDPLAPAVAVELAHSYSLVHDDLPAMDDDTLRRGRATTHVRFGEAMAILTGDALLTRAFEIIASSAGDGPAVVKLVGELAAAAGPAGMIAGQVADMGLCEIPPGLDGAEYIHLRKTAAMIRAAVRMGAICAGADEQKLETFSEFGRTLGLAFQMADDVLDATAQAETIGKTPGKDARAGKRTCVDEVGLDAARKLVDDLSAHAVALLDEFGDRAAKLRRLADLLAERDR